MSEDDDKLVGVEVICPKCEIKNYFWFRSGKQLISEFVNDLYEKDNKIDCDYRCAGEPCKDCTNYTVCDDCSYLIIKKWEEKLK